MSLDAKYLVRKATTAPTLDDLWDDAAWAAAETLNVQWVHSASAPNAPRPVVQAKLQYDAANIYGIYKVDDVSVRATHTVFNSSVCQDSCVEFFFRPRADGGYFNLEMSATGAHLLYFVRDWTPVGDYYADFTAIPESDGRRFESRSSLDGPIPHERAGELTWLVQFQIPIPVAEKYCGPLGELSGQRWTGNFYKCGDHLQHPHWLAWSPVTTLNFHLPDCFGTMLLE